MNQPLKFRFGGKSHVRRYLTCCISGFLLILLSSCSLPDVTPQRDALPEAPASVSEAPAPAAGSEAPTAGSEALASGVKAPVTVAALPTTDIPYGKQPENLLDVYLPEGSGPFPVVLLLHGTDMNKNYFVDTLTTADLVQNGYAAVSIHYRAPTMDAPSAPTQDATCAMAWIYANSQLYPFDTQNIILLGHSRGASLAALMTTLDDLRPMLDGCAYTMPVANGIRAAVTYGGSYATPEVSFSDPTFLNALKKMAGLNDEQAKQVLDALAAIPPAQWRTATDLPEVARVLGPHLPLAWLDGSEAPFLVVHGEVDEIAPAAEAEVFAADLQKAGVRATLAILPGMYHRLNQEALHEPLFKFLAEVTATPR